MSPTQITLGAKPQCSEKVPAKSFKKVPANPFTRTLAFGLTMPRCYDSPLFCHCNYKMFIIATILKKTQFFLIYKLFIYEQNFINIIYYINYLYF